MSLEVWTARINSKDPDRFGVTRKSGGPMGAVFAPSWTILRPALDDMMIARQLGGDVGKAHEDRAWERYAHAYISEMRSSYKSNGETWAALLARPRAVLVCYCTNPKRCHRGVLAWDILPKLGALYCGEVPS